MTAHERIGSAKRSGDRRRAHLMHLETETDGAKVAARLARDSRRRLAKTNLGKLQALQRQQTRWQRKHTIAANKLATVRRQIERLAEEMARATVETEWEGSKQ